MRTKFPTPKEVRRALSKLKSIRDKEWHLGFNIETGFPVRTYFNSDMDWWN